MPRPKGQRDLPEPTGRAGPGPARACASVSAGPGRDSPRPDGLGRRVRKPRRCSAVSRWKLRPLLCDTVAQIPPATGTSRACCEDPRTRFLLSARCPRCWLTKAVATGPCAPPEPPLARGSCSPLWSTPGLRHHAWARRVAANVTQCVHPAAHEVP